jgi:hypothetical protein
VPFANTNDLRIGDLICEFDGTFIDELKARIQEKTTYSAHKLYWLYVESICHGV